MRKDLATVEVVVVDGVAVVRVEGEIDLSNRARVEAELLHARAGTPLVVDLTPLVYLDSAGLALLYRLSERLARDGASLVLIAAEGSIARRAITMSGLDTLIPLRQSVSALPLQ